MLDDKAKALSIKRGPLQNETLGDELKKKKKKHAVGIIKSSRPVRTDLRHSTR